MGRRRGFYAFAAMLVLIKVQTPKTKIYALVVPGGGVDRASRV